jgi:ribosomal protein L32E
MRIIRVERSVREIRKIKRKKKKRNVGMNRQEYRRSIKYISPYGQQQGKKKKKKQQLKPGEKIFIIISLSSLPAPLNKKTKHPSEIGEVVVYNVDVCLRLSIPA